MAEGPGATPSSVPSAPLPKVVVITGPTGVGKTAVGLSVAELLGGEVISADSVQVYRGLDVGSDKLPVSERRGVPHHLLDIREPTDTYSAGCFHDEGRAAIQDCLQRGKVPVVVGGTGFYLRFLVDGKPATQTREDADAAALGMLQQAWEEAATSAGLGRDGADALSPEQRWAAGVAVLGRMGDTEAMQRIGAERNNYYRLRRALAILHSNPGRTLAQLGIGSDAAASEVGEGAAYDFRTFFLYRDRTSLWPKVDARVQDMVVSGLLDEAAMLLRCGLAPGGTVATSAVGYRQAMDWLLQAIIDTQDHGKMRGGLPELVKAVAAATHGLIRRQVHWFRERETYRWLSMEGEGAVERAAGQIIAALGEPYHQGGALEGGGRLRKDEARRVREWVVDCSVIEGSRAGDAAAVMRHVREELIPELAADPRVQPAVEARRQAGRALAEKQAVEQAQRARDREKRKAEWAQRNVERQVAQQGPQGLGGEGRGDAVPDQAAMHVPG